MFDAVDLSHPRVRGSTIQENCTPEVVRREEVWKALVRLNGSDQGGYNIGMIRAHTLGKPPLLEIDRAMKKIAVDGLTKKTGYRHQFTAAGHARCAIQKAQVA